MLSKVVTNTCLDFVNSSISSTASLNACFGRNPRILGSMSARAIICGSYLRRVS